jgi:hypothetical protein
MPLANTANCPSLTPSAVPAEGTKFRSCQEVPTAHTDPSPLPCCRRRSWCPWLRSGVPPDEPCEEMRWAQPHAEVVLRRNPDLELHHVQDPVQDWLMVQRMSYFRLKRRSLGVAYERFLCECLAPGAPSSSSSAGSGGRPHAVAIGMSGSRRWFLAPPTIAAKRTRRAPGRRPKRGPRG